MSNLIGGKSRICDEGPIELNDDGCCCCLIILFFSVILLLGFVLWCMI